MAVSDRSRAEHYRRLMARPDVARFVQRTARVGSGRQARVVAPQHVTDERAFMAALWLAPRGQETLVAGDLGWIPKNLKDEDAVRMILADWTSEAVPYLWHSEIASLAASMPLPAHVIGPDLFPHDLMYWSLSDSLRVQGSEGDDEAVRDPRGYLELSHFMVFRGPDWYALGTFYEALYEDRYRMVGQFELVPFGQRYEPPTGDGRQQSSLGRFLQLAAFLNSPFIRADAVKPPQPKRPNHGRLTPDAVGVHVVTLRAEVREAVTVERGKGPQWKQRWIVRGHYRAQWYPSTRSHRVIWVAPYLKGPDDAPIKQPVYAVVR